MNLAFIANKEIVTYKGHRFTDLQNILYEELKNAIINKTSLIIPSHALMRRCGKTTVIQKLCEEFGLPVVREGGIFTHHDNDRYRVGAREFSSFDLQRNVVFVDEFLSVSQYDRVMKGRQLNVVGVGNIPEPRNNGDVKKVLSRISELSNRYEQIISEGLKHAREYPKPFNQRFYEGLFDGIQPVAAAYIQS